VGTIEERTHLVGIYDGARGGSDLKRLFTAASEAFICSGLSDRSRQCGRRERHRRDRDEFLL
jgi:hypothetical protein